MQFKPWLLKIEGFVQSPVERPDENLRKDAADGKESGAMPTYSLPTKRAKKRQKKS